MDLIKQYSDDEEEKPKLLKISKTIAPDVHLKPSTSLITTGTKELVYNPKYEEVYGPVVGPENPNPKTTVRNLAGHAELFHMNDFVFEEQYQTFQNFGYAQNPLTSTNNFIVGDVEVGQKMNNGISNIFPSNGILETVHTMKGNKKRGKKRKKGEEYSNDPTSDKYTGPWTPFEEEETAEPEDVEYVEITPEEEKELEEKKKREKEEREKKKPKPMEDTSIFHLDEFRDYQGRTFIHPPSHLKPGQIKQNYLPKKWIHTWSGHTKGISAIKFFPQYGHLLLSGSMDCTVKIWDVLTHRKCIRTYLGHTKPIKGLSFQSDGKRFASCSFDKTVKLWDTETGQCIQTFTTGKVPYCVAIHPTPSKSHIMLVGQNDKKIVQWNTQTGKIVQTYDQHLGAVNTITFVDENRRFVTSSDDKTLRVWEFGIPVVIKYIAEPHMHSMPSIAVHPNGKWFAAQSLDNQILVYETRDRFRLHKRKRYIGHLIAGYACQVNFSNDGQFLVSGDSEGKLWFWDWKTCKKLKTIKAHDGVCIACEWHPIEQSKVASGGWDGTIKLFD